MIIIVKLFIAIVAFIAAGVWGMYVERGRGKGKNGLAAFAIIALLILVFWQ